MSRQLITFQLGEQALGVDVTAVREIRAWSPSTPLPGVPDYLRGVINLRGVILPVIDLRCRIGWGTTDPSERHVIIVVESEGRVEGLIVDAVNDILSIEPQDIQPVPELGTIEAHPFLAGIVSADERMVAILDLQRLTDPLVYQDALAA